MTLIGFNAHVVQAGISKRGASQRTDKRPYVLMDAQTLAETICKSSVAELEKLFNGTIHCLAQYGLFLAEMMVAIDGTRIVTTACFGGCGCQQITEWKTDRKGLKVEANLAPYSRIDFGELSRAVTLVADKAYVDGADLYQPDQMHIRFVVIAKTNMAAYGTALCKAVETDTYYERTETVLRRQGFSRIYLGPRRPRIFAVYREINNNAKCRPLKKDTAYSRL